MSNLQYIGARYVPKYYENPDDGSNNWKANEYYEAFTIVTDNYDSYTSKKPVPNNIGAPSLNPEFWVCTTKYSAAIAALQTITQNLENFVDLDETLETISQTVSGAINEIKNSTTKIYNTVADMLTDTSLKTGLTARTLGYYSINDGGNCFYTIRDLDPADVVSVTVDGTTSKTGLIRLPNNLVAEIQTDVLFVNMFGAHKSTVVNSTTMFQNAIDYANAKGKDLFIKAGYYLITDTLFITKHTHIIGENGKATYQSGNVVYIIGKNIPDNKPLFCCDPVTTTYYTEVAAYVYEDITLKNLSLVGQNSFCAIAARTSLSHFENLSIESFKVGFWMSHTYKTYITNVVCASCEISFYLGSKTSLHTIFDKCWASYSQSILTNPTLSSIVTDVLTSCRINYKCGVYIGDTSSGTFNNMSVEAVYYGFYVTYGSTLRINNCGIESIPTNGCGIVANNDSIVQGNNVTFYNPSDYGGMLVSIGYHCKGYINSIEDKPANFVDPYCDRNAILVLDFNNYSWHPTITIDNVTNPVVSQNNTRFTDHNSVLVDFVITYDSYTPGNAFYILGLPVDSVNAACLFLNSDATPLKINPTDPFIGAQGGGLTAPASGSRLQFEYQLNF